MSDDLFVFLILLLGAFLAAGVWSLRKMCSTLLQEVRDLRKELLPESTPVPAPEPEPDVSRQPPPLPETVSAPPPLPPPVHREKSETALAKLWRRIWNWIVVGEEYRREGVPMEVAVATNWLVRIGVLVVVAGIGFFLDYTADRGWLGPIGQLFLALLAGTAALFGGVKLLGKKYHLLAQGFIGLGIAALYGTVFAAEARVQLIGEPLMFAGLCAVTVAAATLSVKIRSLLISVLSVLGGYAVPFLISGDGPLAGLVVYVLMLGVLVVMISRSMDWPLLSWTGLLGHGVVVFSLVLFPRAPDGHVLVLSTGGFLIYSLVPVFMLTRHVRKSTLLELGYLFVNAGGYFLAAYLVLHGHADWSRVLLTAGLCLFYAGTYAWVKSRPESPDRTLSVSILGHAVFFAALTPPQFLAGLTLTTVWAVLAGVLMGMAIWMPSGFLRRTALGMHTVVVLRLAVFDYASVYLRPISTEVSFEGFLKRMVLFGLPILSLAVTLKLLKKGADDAEHLNARRWTGSLLFLTCLSFYQLEIGRSVPAFLPALVDSGQLLGWMVAAGLLMKLYVGNRTFLPGVGMMLSFAAGFWLLLSGDVAWWTGVAPTAAGPALYRWLDFVLLFGFMAAAFREFSNDSRLKLLRNLFGYGALLFFFAFTSREVVWMLNRVLTGSAEGGLSVYWAAFALALVSAGLIRHLRSLRLAGLVLFAVTAGKVILLDLAGLSPVYRIAAFLLLGLLLLAGAFVYLRFQERILPEAADAHL